MNNWCTNCLFLFLLCLSHRNQDFQEVIVEFEGKQVLKMALAYGFRNIQNIVQKIKRGKCPYHFVEVMACPSGELSLPAACGLFLRWAFTVWRLWLDPQVTYQLEEIMAFPWGDLCLTRGYGLSYPTGETCASIELSLPDRFDRCLSWVIISLTGKFPLSAVHDMSLDWVSLSEVMTVEVSIVGNLDLHYKFHVTERVYFQVSWQCTLCVPRL